MDLLTINLIYYHKCTGLQASSIAPHVLTYSAHGMFLAKNPVYKNSSVNLSVHGGSCQIRCQRLPAIHCDRVIHCKANVALL